MAWTIDSEEEMKDLVELGVTGIMTNLPSNLASTLDKLNIRRTFDGAGDDGFHTEMITPETEFTADPRENSAIRKKLLEFIGNR